MSGIMKIIQHERANGLMKGVVARFFKKVLTAFTTFGVYDFSINRVRPHKT